MYFRRKLAHIKSTMFAFSVFACFLLLPRAVLQGQKHVEKKECEVKESASAICVKKDEKPAFSITSRATPTPPPPPPPHHIMMMKKQQAELEMKAAVLAHDKAILHLQIKMKEHEIAQKEAQRQMVLKHLADLNKGILHHDIMRKRHQHRLHNPAAPVTGTDK